MVARKMHADEIAISHNLVQNLINEQFPELSHLSLRAIDSSGTDNAIFRLGDRFGIRLPRFARATQGIENELRWLPCLAPQLPLPIPTPYAQGKPTDAYPLPWYIYCWLDGHNAITANITDLRQAAQNMGTFITALHKIDPKGGPLCVRGRPLTVYDRETRAAIVSRESVIDASAASGIWQAALDAPAWDQAPVWVHGDLHPGNVLVKDGRISAVIDFGMAGIGDPACDMMVAWTLLSEDSRGHFRDAVQVDDATWQRGRGWALFFGLVAFDYYQKTNPVLARIAWRTIHEVLSDTSL